MKRRRNFIVDSFFIAIQMTVTIPVECEIDEVIQGAGFAHLHGWLSAQNRDFPLVYVVPTEVRMMVALVDYNPTAINPSQNSFVDWRMKRILTYPNLFQKLVHSISIAKFLC